MKFTETGSINFSKPIYLPMPHLFIELFDAWEKLPEPDMVRHLQAIHPNGMNPISKILI